jgi:TonB family protein
MKQEQRGGAPGAGPVDPGLAQRVEGLVDEAVALAAKGSYRDAAARAEEARSLDPDNGVARDLLESYRRLAQDDDERRRRRRSIAAAAAAIEEMIEIGRLEEAATAVEALSMQYGVEAPVDELRARIAVARANDEGFEELDAAIDAIRQPASVRAATPPARLDAVGTLAAEIEDHLRSGRLEEASGRLDKLESMPGSEERLHKLRTRIEEARHVADEHRREEEILIATAAIEERIRRGSIEDAASRLEALATSHGSSAPIAELRQRLQEARDLAAAAASEPAQGGPAMESGAGPSARSGAAASAGSVAGGIGASERTAELLGVETPGVPHAATLDAPFADFGEAGEAAGRRGKRIAMVAAAVIAIVAAGWWLVSGSPEAVPAAATAPSGVASPAGADPAATDPPTAGVENTAADAAAPAQAQGPPDTADAIAGDAATRGVDAASTEPASPASPPSSPPEAVENPSSEDVVGRPADQVSAAAPDAGAALPPETVAADSAPGSGPPGAAVTDSAPATAERAADAAVPEAPAGTVDENRAEVVVDAMPAGAEAAVPPPVESVPEEPRAETEVASAPPPDAQPDDDADRVASTEQSAPTALPASAAPARPALLGCGEPGVVCVKPLRVPQPSYPAVARQRRLSANVVIFALVDETGRVIQTRVGEGAAMRFFTDAAEEAARRAVFQPASRGGVPGRSWARLAFQFTPR